MTEADYIKASRLTQMRMIQGIMCDVVSFGGPSEVCRVVIVTELAKLLEILYRELGELEIEE